ncbi:MAG: Rrf2 family transcriptional regulator [Deltaproteobacteria bacterium]|nr:Rrf2 family transcriptional regulator [Deltaproteobacteria bacterium]
MHSTGAGSQIFPGATHEVFSPTCQYAIRALSYLAQHADNGPVLARDIAGAEKIPQQFLSKILHQLGLKGLVRSQKGPGGGFALARSPAKISIADISAAVDGVPNAASQCLLGMSRCHDSTGCVLHREWKTFRSQYESRIASRTLEELAASEGSAKRRAARPRAAKNATASASPTAKSRKTAAAPARKKS